MTRVLVAYASKNGSTAGVAEAIGGSIAAAGFDVDVVPAGWARDVEGYDAVVVGSAIYSSRWRPDAVRFLRRNLDALAAKHVWLFQSGPLDPSAESRGQGLPSQVSSLAHRIGARGYVTFGGKLDKHASGFIARAMVRNGAGGDFRNFERIRAWGHDVSRELTGLLTPAALQTMQE
jgi:menaquinone-dependent protoporphyrinogen oxidase